MRRYPCHYITTLIAIFTLFISNAQVNNSFQQRKKLTVQDYKGLINENEDYLARTYTTVSVQYHSPVVCSQKEEVRAMVETSVSVSTKSWMKLYKIRTRETLNELLSHEQGHFDISEVFATDLKNTLSGLCFNKGSYKKSADSVFQSKNRYYDGLQRQYDTDTDHMRNKDMQLKWKRRIAMMLEKAMEP